MAIREEDSKSREKREEKEREFLTETEERRLAHNLELARLQVDVELYRAKRWGWIRIFMVPAFMVVTICLTILAAKGKDLPDALTEFLNP